MKSATLTSICTTILLAALTFPVASFAQTPAQTPQHHGPGSYLVFNLGTFGGTSSSGNTINNLGWVMGNANLAGNQTTNAALWIYGRKADLGTLGGPNSSVAWPVHNTNGMISGIAETSIIDPLGEIWSCGFFFPTFTGHTCQGFLWQNGTMAALPTLGGNNSYGAGINNRAQIAGWAENTTQDPTCNSPQVLQFEAVVWQWKRNKIETQSLPPLSPDPDSAATDINDAGQVVGISGLCSNAVGGASAIHALLWQDGVPTDLGNLGGMAWNTPSAINNKGEIVGFSNTSGDENAGLNPHAFLWTKENGMQDLGTLAGDSVSEAVSLNDQGQIVGLSCVDNTFSNCHGFLWQDGMMTDLNNLIQPGNLSIYTANDINSSGEITGVAIDSATGEFLAMIAVPGPYNPSAAPSAQGDGIVSKTASPKEIIVPRVGLRSLAQQPAVSQ
ncbi:MAG: DUF3466 family protein [Terriglobales bacterium]